MVVRFRRSDRTVPLNSAVPLSTNIRALLLDTCGIFYDDTVWQRWLLRVLNGLGLQTNYRSFFHLWSQDCMADVHRGRIDFREAFERFLFSVGLTRAQIEEVRLSCEARRNQSDTTKRLLPGVKATLTQLHTSGIILGVLCNSEQDSKGLVDRLAQLGLEGLFTTVETSFELGHVISETACYRIVLARMGLEAHQVAFVGHDTAELAGAAAVGITTIALNFDANAQADVYLNRFTDLLELFQTPTSAAAG